MVAIRASRPADVARLLEIWRRAVQATHHFLKPEDIPSIEATVARDYLPAASFWVAVDDADQPIGFMGLSGPHVDSLFIDPDWHGRGVGSGLVRRAIAQAGTLTVDVNEQNDRAAGFYARLGFRQVGRSPADDAGRPYPILHLSMAD